MIRILRILAAGAVLAGPAFLHPASAQPAYPRVVGSGEDVSVEYGPGAPGNVIGGGGAVISGSGEDTALRHLDPRFAQPPRQRPVPLVAGSGEGATTVWVATETDRTRRALVGADGSLPAEAGSGPGQLARLLRNVFTGG